ncbi:unnamed protein product, partial [Rotaria magnacalcarata]
RFLLACLPCILLTYLTCENLTQYNTRSILTISICWFMTINLISLTVFPRQPLITSSLVLTPFVEKGSPFLMLNHPPFVDIE